MSPGEITFPYPDQAFDFSFAISLFTHMLPQAVERYLVEIMRTLKPDGRGLLTWFLLNDDSDRLSRLGKSQLDFDVVGDGYRTISRDVPEAAVAYREDDVRALLGATGFEILSPIHHGHWCGRSDGRWYQDLILVTRDGGSRSEL